MIIRQGTVEEMLNLWHIDHTSEFFAQKIRDGKAEFWTVEKGKMLIGELYFFAELPDLQLANGTDTAYLAAFRIAKPFRGQGLGTRLMNRVFDRLKEKGFSHATIGVYLDAEDNLRLYRKLGFTQTVKQMELDYCMVDEHFRPMSSGPYTLLKKDLD